MRPRSLRRRRVRWFGAHCMLDARHGGGDRMPNHPSQTLHCPFHVRIKGDADMEDWLLFSIPHPWLGIPEWENLREQIIAGHADPLTVPPQKGVREIPLPQRHPEEVRPDHQTDDGLPPKHLCECKGEQPSGKPESSRQTSTSCPVSHNDQTSCPGLRQCTLL